MYADKAEIPYIKGEKKPDGLRRILGAFMKTKLPDSLAELPEGTLHGVEIIKTPGHTPGHVCFQYENVLFIGDLLRTSKNELTLSSAIFTWDKAKVLDSCKSLKLDGIEWLCPAHGEPIRVKPAWEAFEKRYLKTNTGETV